MLNKIYKLFLVICVSISLSYAADQGDIKAYVNNLVDSTSAILHNSSLSVNEKTARCKNLLKSNLEIDWMAKQAIGRNITDSTLLAKYKNAYTNYIIRSYSDLVKSYKGEKIQILKVTSVSSNEYIVNTQIVNPNTQAQTKIDYLVKRAGKSFKVEDIITEGISMIDSQRSEFSGMVSNQGAEALINYLQNNTENN